MLLYRTDPTAVATDPPPPLFVPIEALRRRGPDSVQQETLGSAAADGFELRLTGSVLHMRGSQCVPQPLRDAVGNVLLWNGEVFGEAPGGTPLVQPGETLTLTRTLTLVERRRLRRAARSAVGVRVRVRVRFGVRVRVVERRGRRRGGGRGHADGVGR